jgi:hypothetical protein
MTNEDAKVATQESIRIGGAISNMFITLIHWSRKNDILYYYTTSTRGTGSTASTVYDKHVQMYSSTPQYSTSYRYNVLQYLVLWSLLEYDVRVLGVFQMYL